MLTEDVRITNQVPLYPQGKIDPKQNVLSSCVRQNSEAFWSNDDISGFDL